MTSQGAFRAVVRAGGAGLWYRAVFVTYSIGLTLVSWLVIGGRVGALVWIAGFMVAWGFTRAANGLLGGFLLGSDDDEEDLAETPRPRR